MENSNISKACAAIVWCTDEDGSVSHGNVDCMKYVSWRCTEQDVKKNKRGDCMTNECGVRPKLHIQLVNLTETIGVRTHSTDRESGRRMSYEKEGVSGRLFDK